LEPKKKASIVGTTSISIKIIAAINDIV
jgi:hypothetical protein